MQRTTKQYVSIILSLLLLFACLPVAPSFAANTTYISSAEEFLAFVNGDPSADATLDADLDLGEWTTAFPDGYYGTLDGNGHSITYTKTNPTGNFHALIKVLNEGGVIRNLTIRGSMTFTAARNYDAPFVYENHGAIENCVNEMSVTHTGTKNCQYVAGITAKNYGTVKDCTNNAAITARNYVGGIVSQNYGGSVLGCVNNGAVIASNTAGYAGGIVAAILANASDDVVLLENCVNTGSVTGGSGNYGFAGGVIGQINIASSYNTYGTHPTITVRGCSSSGALSAGGGTDEILAKNNNPDYSTLVIEAGVPAHVHSYDDGTVTKEPTCVAPGEILYVCTGCDAETEGHTKTEAIPATGVHTPGGWTEETVGDEALFVRRCSVCGEITAKKSAAATKTLENALDALQNSWFRLSPVFGKDTNVCEMLSSKLRELGYEGIGVTLAAAENPADGCAAVADDGEIRYFYADPAVWRAMYFCSVPVTFTLTLADAQTPYEANALLHWDADRAEQAIRDQIADRVTEDEMRGENENLSAVTTDLVLPKTVTDGNGERVLWSLITWESSDPDVITIDDAAQSGADTLFEPYAGIVKRGVEDRTVTLTARFSFQRTSYDEPEISYRKTFDVTVKGMGDELLAEMQRQLDANYTAEKLTYIGSKLPVDPESVTDDVQLLLPRTSGVEHPGDYTFTVESDSPNAVVNTARLNVFRPLPGEKPAAVTLKVTMKHRNFELSVSKNIKITVAPITREELDAHLALMEQVKASLFEGVNNGANAGPDAVTENLSPFIEAIPDGEGGVRWVRSVRDVTDGGVTAVSVDPARPSEQWDRFRSSDPTVLSHETLLVTRQAADADVTLTVCLSDAAFARYAALYPDDPVFAALNRQIVTLRLTVKGTDESTRPGVEPEIPETEPETPDSGVCAFCGRIHTGLFGRIVGFLHRIVLFFRDLFGTGFPC